MNLEDIGFIFNRAITHSFVKAKLLFIFCMLTLSGVLVVFFRGLAMHAGNWMTMSLTFLPIFVSSAILLSAGIVLTRLYHDEVKNQPSSLMSVMKNSWELMVGASYFSIPIILCYLLFWMALGVFILLSEIPTVGDFFAVVLAFGPFLLNLGSLFLCLLSLSLLFFVTPVIALRRLNRTKILETVLKRVRLDLFSHLLLGFIAIFPLLVIVGLLILSAILSETIINFPPSPLHIILQWFFVMIPFAAILSPAVVFYFNFAAESHVFLQKYLSLE